MKKIALKNATRGTAFDYAGQSWILLATAKLLQLPSSKARVSMMSLLRQRARPSSFSSRIQLWPA